MTTQITLIGLGQIGASMGLALGSKKDLLLRVGYDREMKIARQAESIGAIDRVEAYLSKAVQGADLVVLAIPLSQIQETLELVVPHLRENAVVMDTAPLKKVVDTWVGNLFPEGRHYVGLLPAINPAYLHSMGRGIEAAHADLFQKGLMVIMASSHANSDAVKLATDLTQLLGSTPLFADSEEVDGLMSAANLLPQLMAVALINATMDKPGWREGRKLAGKEYAGASILLSNLNDIGSLKSATLLNRENSLRVLDNAIYALSNIRTDIERENEEALEELLRHAQSARENWWKDRQAGEWLGDGLPPVDTTEIPSMFTRMFGVGKRPKTKK